MYDFHRNVHFTNVVLGIRTLLWHMDRICFYFNFDFNVWKWGNFVVNYFRNLIYFMFKGGACFLQPFLLQKTIIIWKKMLILYKFCWIYMRFISRQLCGLKIRNLICCLSKSRNIQHFLIIIDIFKKPLIWIFE